MATKRVTFARDYVSGGGKHYKGGSTHSVDYHEARSLLNRGTVRLADEDKTPEAAAKPETQKTDNKEK